MLHIPLYINTKQIGHIQISRTWPKYVQELAPGESACYSGEFTLWEKDQTIAKNKATFTLRHIPSDGVAILIAKSCELAAAQLKEVS